MIDDKKIEEASEKYAKEMEETCKKLVKKYKSSTSLCNWVTVNPVAAFQDGINWFLDNLWHDASEEPERDRDILLEYENGHPSDVRMRLPYQYENIYYSLCEKYWSAMVKIEKITRWLYIDDLKGRR